MTFAESTLRWQRWLLAAMLLGSAVIVLPSAVEPFMLPKLTLILVLAIGLVSLAVARAAAAREIHLPVSPVVWAVTAFALALVVSTVTSATPWASVIGFYGRYTGLVPYLGYLAVFLAVVRLSDSRLAWLLLRTGLVALGFVVAYGLLQATGADPFDYVESRNGTTFSFLGNLNFSAAWAGCLLGAVLVVGLVHDQSSAWRWYAAILAPATVLYIGITGTVQGVGTAVLSVLATALVLLAGPSTRLGDVIRRRPRAALTVAGGAPAAVLAVGAVGLFAFRAQVDRALTDRPDFWVTALRIFADRPLIGTGLDTYAHHFLAQRPTSLALSDGLQTTDAPHSVLLGMFSNGGLLLGLSYVAVVLLVGAALVRGVKAVAGPERMAFAAFAGIWVAYQAQSLVSFDVPPLALLHWMSAGVIVALAAPPSVRTFALPGRRPAPVGRRSRSVRPAPLPASTKIVFGGFAALSLLLGWFALYPLRADLVAASAAPLGRSGQLDAAVERLSRAADLNPAEGSYSFLVARALEAAKQPDEAFAAATEAAERDPGAVLYTLFAARQARDAGLAEEAAEWYRESIDRDPNDPVVLNEAAVYFLQTDQPAVAVKVAARSVELREDVDALLVLGQAQEEQGELAEARSVYERVLELEPDNELVTTRLAALGDEGD